MRCGRAGGRSADDAKSQAPIMRGIYVIPGKTAGGSQVHHLIRDVVWLENSDLQILADVASTHSLLGVPTLLANTRRQKATVKRQSTDGWVKLTHSSSKPCFSASRDVHVLDPLFFLCGAEHCRYHASALRCGLTNLRVHTSHKPSRLGKSCVVVCSSLDHSSLQDRNCTAVVTAFLL